METGLSLGSNLGDRLANLSAAKKQILAIPGVKLLAQSPVYETDPVGVRPEYKELKFLNVILVVDGPWDAHSWFDRLRAIEGNMGRHRGLDRFAPRAIDIDIIYVGDVHIESGGLVVPHPRWMERRFVVQPLADVRPDLLLPGMKRTVKQVLDALPEDDGVALLTRDW